MGLVDGRWIRNRMDAKDDRINAELRRKFPPRRQRAEGCLTCARYPEGAMFPRHDASPRCESGQRPHCSCSTCF